MALEAYPAALPCGVIRYGFTGGLKSAGAPFGLPAGQGATISGPHWVASQSDAPLRTAAQLLALRALQGRQDGGGSGLLLPVCVGQLSPQISGGVAIAAIIDGAAVAGATALTLDISAGDFHDLVGGERFNLTHADATTGVRLYQVDEVTGGTRTAPQIRITPPLRAAIADGATVSFDNLVAPMRCTGGLANQFDQNRFGDVEAAWEEWFEELVVHNLRDLALSPHSVESGSPEDTNIGFILNTTAGSTIALTDTAGGRFKLVDHGDGTWSITAGATATDYDAHHSHNITVVETLAGYGNSPHPSILTVNVVQPLATSMVLTITNPDFETGDLTGWTVSDPSVEVRPAIPGITPHTGTYMLWGGTVGASTLYQTGDGDAANPHFDVTSFAARIDTGRVTLQGWAGWRNEYTDQGDTGRIEVWFFDEDDALIGAIHHVDGLNANIGWQHLVFGDLTVPVGTRSIRLGGYNFRAVGPALQNAFDSFVATVTLQFT